MHVHEGIFLSLAQTSAMKWPNIQHVNSGQGIHSQHIITETRSPNMSEANHKRKHGMLTDTKHHQWAQSTRLGQPPSTTQTHVGSLGAAVQNILLSIMKLNRYLYKYIAK